MISTATAKQAGISEIFSSLQGEGTHLGERHIFVRFERCNIHCDYCDELGKPGADLSVSQIIETIKNLEREEGPHAFVSLTGGEPLFYHPFLKALCPELKKNGFKLYLETNGILWKPFRELAKWFDVVAMDMKPASVTKEQNYFEEHKRFLEETSHIETFVKMVISKEIDILEFKNLCEIIQNVRSKTPLILQPISELASEGHDDSELMRLLGELQKIASHILSDVRIVPRLHKVLRIP